MGPTDPVSVLTAGGGAADPLPAWTAGSGGSRFSDGDDGGGRQIRRRRRCAVGIWRSGSGLGFRFSVFNFFCLLNLFLHAASISDFCMRLHRPHAKSVIFADLLAHAVGATACKDPSRPHAKRVFVVVLPSSHASTDARSSAPPLEHCRHLSSPRQGQGAPPRCLPYLWWPTQPESQRSSLPLNHMDFHNPLLILSSPVGILPFLMPYLEI